MKFDYDVAYLGSGHSCWHGALTLAAAGKKVVLMDHDLPGGACTNYGCACSTTRVWCRGGG